MDKLDREDLMAALAVEFSDPLVACIDEKLTPSWDGGLYRLVEAGKLLLKTREYRAEEDCAHIGYIPGGRS